MEILRLNLFGYSTIFMSDDRAMFAKADITTYSKPSIQIGWSPGETPAQMNYLEAI